MLSIGVPTLHKLHKAQWQQQQQPIVLGVDVLTILVVSQINLQMKDCRLSFSHRSLTYEYHDNHKYILNVLRCTSIAFCREKSVRRADRVLFAFTIIIISNCASAVCRTRRDTITILTKAEPAYSVFQKSDELLAGGKQKQNQNPSQCRRIRCSHPVTASVQD